MTTSQRIEKAAQLERDADMLHASLLAPSMAETAMREEAKSLRQEGGCPTCTSPGPHLHPAMQHGGEVQPCRDPYHLTITPQNTPERIEQAQAILRLTA